jgi:hypothetical protein
VLARNAHGLADEFAAACEDSVGTLADILGGDPREHLVSHGEGDCERPVLPSLRLHAKVDEVLPVEPRQKERRGHAQIGEEVVSGRLPVEMGHLVLPLQGRHPVALE